MEKILAIVSISILIMVVLINALANTIGYLTDMIGEVLIVCGLPIVAAGIIFVACRMLIGYNVGRIDAMERAIYLERLSIENQAMLLDLEMVKPVHNVLPVPRQIVMSGEITDRSLRLLETNIIANRTHPPGSVHYSVKNDNHMPEPQMIEDHQPASIPDYSELLKSGDVGRVDVLLGYTDGEQLRAAPHKIKSIVCGGLSRSGKSNTTRFLLAQYAELGWRLAIFDPHGNNDDGILPSLMALSDSFWMPPAIEFDDGLEMLRCVMLEGKRRLAVEGAKQADFEPVMFVIDEVAQFAQTCDDQERKYMEKSLPVLLNSFAKVNMFGFCISQFWSKDFMGDLGFILRRSSQTRIIHRMPTDSAKVIERYADFEGIENLPTGTCMFNNTDIKYAKLQIPLCDLAHMPTAAHSTVHSGDASDKRHVAFQIEQKRHDEMSLAPEHSDDALSPEDQIYLDAAQDLTPSQRIQVENAINDGCGNGKIVASVFDHPNKTRDRKGRKYAAMINGVRIEMGVALPYSPSRANK